MGEQHGRRVRPKWPAVTRTRFDGGGTDGDLVPTLVPAGSGTGPRVRSHRHLELVTELAGRADWSGRALHACLTQLLSSTVTEARRVWVVDAWPDTAEDGLCVVYRPPLDEGRVVGLRRRRRDAIEASDWRLGDMTTWGYDLHTAAGSDEVDPERFGWNVADFDLGEPLGYVTTVLRYDAADIGWWGNLDDELPVPPRSSGAPN